MDLVVIAHKAFWFWLGGVVCYGGTTLVTSDDQVPSWMKMLTIVVWPYSLFTVISFHLRELKRGNS